MENLSKPFLTLLVLNELSYHEFLASLSVVKLLLVPIGQEAFFALVFSLPCIYKSMKDLTVVQRWGSMKGIILYFDKNC
jgi:hypothetical protein